MSEQSQADVDRRIEDFLAANIAIPNTARVAASKSQNRLREILANKSTTDATFPHLLSRVDEDFLGGSFARHTKIWPLDDIDIYFPIDGAGLFYVQNGGRLPFSLLTDNPLRPQRLLNAEWLRGQYIGSDLVLSGFLKAVAQAYPNSKLRGDQHAVCLGTTVAATSESVGIGFDIVPCFCLAPDGGGTNIYLIPDGSGSWLRTNPRVDTVVCKDLHDYHNKTFRKVVRLVKYWNANGFNGRFASYFIELAIGQCFLEQMRQGKSMCCISEALAWAFYALKQASDKGSLNPFVEGCPVVNAPQLTLVEGALLTTVPTLSNGAWNSVIAENVDLAIAYLKRIFGDNFGP